MGDAQRIEEVARRLVRTGRLAQLKQYRQHGEYTVYAHSVNVAVTALRIARRLRLKLDEDAMIRGALLHDYFLYDWHTPDPHRPKHAFFHPRVAWENARRDYALGLTEEDIIRHHMFPLVPSPPRTAEGWVVCLADTVCAIGETLGRRRSPALPHSN